MGHSAGQNSHVYGVEEKEEEKRRIFKLIKYIRYCTSIMHVRFQKES